MKALGLDPSLRAYGWAYHNDEATGRLRRASSGHEETLPSTIPVARFMHFRSMVGKLIRDYNPDVIGIESPAYSAGPFQTIHFGLMMFSLEAAFEARKDCVLFDPATLKLLARSDPKLKKGQMSKLDMQRVVSFDTMDPSLIDNNEADAYCVAMFAARLKRVLNGSVQPSSLTPSEKHVFLGRKKISPGRKIKRMAHVFRENSRFFRFSSVPVGDVSLPKRSEIRPELMTFLNELESDEKLSV